MKYRPSRRIRAVFPSDTPPEAATAVGENTALGSSVRSQLATECEAAPAMETIEIAAAAPIATLIQVRHNLPANSSAIVRATPRYSQFRYSYNASRDCEWPSSAALIVAPPARTRRRRTQR